MGQKIDRTYLFERMPVGQAVRRQIIPSIASQMVILLYNLADTYFVGLLNDAAQTAAVSLAYSVTLLMTALANLFAVGGAGRIAQLLGRRDRDGAREVCAVSFWFALLASAAFCVLFTLLSSPILRLCGATDETYALACGYSRWVISVGGTFSILNTVLANLIRADGSAFAASMGVSAGGIINMLLDPLFVLPRFLGMGAEGAGLATAISNAAGMLILLGIIAARRRVGVVALRPDDLRATRRHIGRILRIGLPSAVQFLLTLVAVGALTKFMSLYDTAAVAALGIVKKLDMLPLYFSIGVANGLLPLLAYNYSAENHERRHRIFLCGCAVAVGFSVVCVAGYEVFAPALVRIFIGDAQTIAYGTKLLRIMVLAMPMMSVCYPMITQFQAMGRMRESLICSILRKGSLDIPLLFVLNALFPLYGCAAVQPIVDCICMIVAIYFYKKLPTA